MSVMNRAGQDSCSYQGDEVCPLHHFLEKEEGDEEDGGIPREVRRSETGEAKGALANPRYL